MGDPRSARTFLRRLPSPLHGAKAKASRFLAGDGASPAGFVCEQLGEEAEGYGARDFVYAMGLYDYLPEAIGRKLASVLYDLLAPRGRLVIGNYAAHADAQDFLDLVCDWHLIYRSASDVRALASDLPADAAIDVRLDSTGTVYVLVVSKP